MVGTDLPDPSTLGPYPILSDPHNVGTMDEWIMKLYTMCIQNSGGEKWGMRLGRIISSASCEINNNQLPNFYLSLLSPMQACTV
jgi:hypothetical protein